jgi:TRAP-type C4-dicarboxylate transport system permease small subunit
MAGLPLVTSLFMLHLLMAACWLVLGAFLLSWQWSNPNSPVSIGSTGIPLGWFCVALAVYNLLRWWLNRRSRGL